MHPQLENYLAQVRAQLKALPQEKVDEEIQEIHNHLLALIDSQMQSGDSQEEAIAAALRQFGPPQKVGHSLRKAWQASSVRERKTTPINKFVSATIWGLAFNTVAGVAGASIYGAWAGVYIGSQLKEGRAPDGHFPGMETWVAVVTYGPELVGLMGLLLALFGRLPIFHLERKAK